MCRRNRASVICRRNRISIATSTRARRWIFSETCFICPKGERDNRAEQLLEMVGLGKTQTRAVGEFSKGMQRRIGLAQALINDPDLVILDEPTAGLDPIGCREVKDLIIALARRGKTVILSSHLLSDVEDVCDRVVIYYGGKIQAAGHAEGIARRRRTRCASRRRCCRAKLWSAFWKSSARTSSTGEVRVDNPTQNLESYFLDVVQKARGGGRKPAARNPARAWPTYLRAACRGSQHRRRKKSWKNLALPQAAPAGDQTAVGPPPAPKVDDKKLEALAQASRASTVASQAATAPEAKPVDLSKADEKLVVAAWKAKMISATDGHR